MAEPPAESPSTIYTSVRSASFQIQSANFSGIRVADNCTQALLKGDYEAFRDALSPRMQDYLPTDALRCQMEDILSPLGAFCKLGTTLTDSKLPNVIHCYVEYERMGLDLKYVFHGEQICGFWAHYYLIGGAV